MILLNQTNPNQTDKRIPSPHDGNPLVVDGVLLDSCT